MNKKLLSLVIAVSLITTITVVVLTLALATHPKGTVSAQSTVTSNQTGNQNQGGVTVTGMGSVLVTPDIVSFDAGVDLHAATVNDAQKQVTQVMDAIKKAINNLGISDEDIKTSNYQIRPDYVYDQNKSARLDGYNINTSWHITVRDVTKIGAAIDASASAGANQIGSISFGRDSQIDLIKQARTAAVQDAKSKAEQLAAAGGFSLGDVQSVIEYGNSQPLDNVRNALQATGAAASMSDTTTIQGGQFKVTVNVQVVYNIK